MKTSILLSLLFCSGILAYGQSQSEMNKTVSQEYAKLDKELNSTYQQILNDYKTDTLFIRNLKKSQKIWLSLRDSEMKTMFPGSQADYGSVFPLCWNNYISSLTQERIKHLKTWIDGTKEGDVCAGSVRVIP